MNFCNATSPSEISLDVRLYCLNFRWHIWTTKINSVHSWWSENICSISTLLASTLYNLLSDTSKSHISRRDSMESPRTLDFRIESYWEKNTGRMLWPKRGHCMEIALYTWSIGSGLNYPWRYVQNFPAMSGLGNQGGYRRFLKRMLNSGRLEPSPLDPSCKVRHPARLSFRQAHSNPYLFQNLSSTQTWTSCSLRDRSGVGNTLCSPKESRSGFHSKHRDTQAEHLNHGIRPARGLPPQCASETLA